MKWGRKKEFRQEKGAAFLMVLAALLIMMLMGSGFTVMVRYEIKQIRAHRNKMRAFYTAEAGLQVITLRRAQRPLEKCSTTVTAVGTFEYPINDPAAKINSADKKQGEVEQVECYYLDADTLARQGDQSNPEDVEVIETIATAKVEDTSEGLPQTFRGKHSWFIRSPFSKAVWATGNLDFRTSFPLGWCLVTFSLWCADDMWSITGKVFSKGRPYDDWERHCPPFDWFDECRKYWLVGWRCCLLLKGCSSGETCCCGFPKDTGARYAVRKRNGDTFRVCGQPGSPDGINGPTAGYNGDCNLSGTDDEAEGETGGGPAGSGWYFVRQKPTDEPFPQFTPPPDPRLPGANTGLTWKTGADCTNDFRNQGFLQDVWCDGDVTINYGWIETLGVQGIGIWGTVYVHGRLTYVGSTFSRLKLYAYPGWTNCIPGDMPPALCPGNKPPEDKLPGTLIVNKGNLSITSSGTPDLGRVNIVLVQGTRLEIASFCGLRSFGVYYVGGPEVDHDGNPNTPPIRMGGDIYFKANTRYGGLVEPLRVVACDWLPDWWDPLKEFVGQLHSEFHGAVIGNDIFFTGGEKWKAGDPISPDPNNDGLPPVDGDDCNGGSLNTRENCPNYLNIMDNPELVLPLGFYNSIKAWNWRDLL